MQFFLAFVMGGIYAIFYVGVMISMYILSMFIFTSGSAVAGLLGGLFGSFFVKKPLRLILKTIDEETSKSILIKYLNYKKKIDNKNLIINLFSMSFIVLGFISLRADKSSLYQYDTIDGGLLYNIADNGVILIIIGMIIGAYTALKLYLFTNEKIKMELYTILLLKDKVSKEQLVSYVSEMEQYYQIKNESYKNDFKKKFQDIKRYPLDSSNEAGYVLYNFIENSDFKLLEDYQQKYFNNINTNIDNKETKNSKVVSFIKVYILITVISFFGVYFLTGVRNFNIYIEYYMENTQKHILALLIISAILTLLFFILKFIGKKLKRKTA